MRGWVSVAAATVSVMPAMGVGQLHAAVLGIKRSVVVSCTYEDAVSCSEL